MQGTSDHIVLIASLADMAGEPLDHLIESVAVNVFRINQQIIRCVQYPLAPGY